LGLFTWLSEKLSGTSDTVNFNITSEEDSIAVSLCIRNLAFQSAVNLIANSISKCEFKTYMEGVEVKGKEYYLWNVEPNLNQNSSEFIHKWISKLYKENECLIIEQNGQLLVADSFTIKEYALYGHQFSNVTVGDFLFSKTFNMSDVLYYKLNNDNIRKVINAMFEDYGKLIKYAETSYLKSRGSKGILDISTMAQNNPNFAANIKKLFEEDFKKFFTADNAALPLYEGWKYTDTGSKTYSNEGTRDIKAMVDDIYDFTARALGIPPALLKGDIANIENVVDNFLTFCVDPLTDMLSEENNRKRNGYSGFIQNNYLRIDTTTIKHFDILSSATNIDKLISSAVFCINDIRKIAGLEVINEEWANKHFITKNYTDVEDMLTLEGGGKE